MPPDARLERGWGEETRVVAVDGGTTNTRARLLVGRRVVAEARRAVGVRDAVLSPGLSPLAEAVAGAIAEVIAAGGGEPPAGVVAAGMLTAEVGLCPVPHVLAPAGLAELARGVVVRRLPEVAEWPIAFVPGVRTPPGPGPAGWAEADVMRGEECATLGAWAALGRPGACAFVWPGSHTKLVAVDAAGRIVRGFTTLAGELTQAVARHTLLAASLPTEPPEAIDDTIVDAAARLVDRHGLGRAAFAVRVADLLAALDPPGRAAFWVGAVAADDAAHLARHPILAGSMPVWVGGAAPRRGLYARLLARRRPGPVRALDDGLAEAASALGAIEVAAPGGGGGGGTGAGGGGRGGLRRWRIDSTTRRPGR